MTATDDAIDAMAQELDLGYALDAIPTDVLARLLAERTDPPTEPVCTRCDDKRWVPDILDERADSPVLYEGKQISANYDADKGVTQVVIRVPGYAKAAFNDHRPWDHGVRVVAIDQDGTDG